MDTSSVPKPPSDSTSTVTSDTTTTTTKRRYHYIHQHQQPPPSPLKLAASETLFRILCPAAKTAGVIGKDGAIIRQFREETGAKIRIEDAVPGCDERVILIIANGIKPTKNNTFHREGNHHSNNSNGTQNTTGEELGNVNGNGEDEGSLAQQALVRVFERILMVDGSENCMEKEKEGIGGGNANAVVCRLLASSGQVGSVIGRGGKIVEKIRQESGAPIRILPKDHIPACASPGDELIQITGNLSAVKKALISVSSCLQDNPRTEATNLSATRPSGMVAHGTHVPGQMDPFLQRSYTSGSHAGDYHFRGHSSTSGSDNIGVSNRMVTEEEIVFKLLCPHDKVGSLIGKGGSVIRALQNETGASIKIVDSLPDSDERVVLISAQENLEQKPSPAQEAVVCVQSRIAEIGFEPGAAVVARLLVHFQQIGCLLGKGGFIIAEMRRATGASIRVFPKEQVPKCGSQHDELVQVIGSLQSVQDALYHITSRLRETMFPMKPPFSNVSGPPYMSSFPERPPPLFRPRIDTASPSHYASSVGFPYGIDRPAPHQPFDHQPAFSHGMEHSGPPNVDRGPFSYGGDRPPYGPTFDRPPSPRPWTHKAVSSGNPRGVMDVGSGLAPTSGHTGSGSKAHDLTSASVEIVVPQIYLSYVYGENNSNLIQIRQISGAKVIVHGPKLGATEGVVVVSGAPDQMHLAQSLVHAFILCGKTAP